MSSWATVNVTHLPGPGPEKVPGKPRNCFKLKITLIVVVILATVIAATLIPLFATGVIKLSSHATTPSALRLTYDPLYYGNLHPYLYPSEQQTLNIRTDYDVVIVGAGIAGLAAAWVLQEQGNLNVLVLEARVR